MADSPESACVLVVDDNEANRLLAQSTLEDEGYRVVVAEGGAQAIAAFDESPPDCILLDVRMPEMDGFTVCERIRGMPRGDEVPIVFLTALRDVDTFDKALKAGGDDFLTKPVRPTELVVRVQTALELRRLRGELRGQYELLKRQRDDLLRVQLQKERLMAFLVHDLKNPVNSLDLHAQLLLRQRDLSPRARESATQIRNEAKRLTKMILNLLDLSKADEGKLTAQRTPIDLRTFVDDLFGELDVSAKDADVELVADLGVEGFSGDPDLIRRAFGNLLENAIRHAPAKTSVTVLARSKDGAIELRVQDAGPGLPPEVRERIFDPFVQVEAGGERTVSRSGRGLGLAFAKRAVEAHGGTIWVEDAAPGAIFCVRLPR